MPDSPLEQLIAALRADDTGSLARRVQLALAFARDHLVDAAEGASSGAVDGAVEQVAHAIETLQSYRQRLEQLAADLEGIERDLGRIRSGDADVGEDGPVGLSGLQPHPARHRSSEPVSDPNLLHTASLPTNCRRH